MPLKRLRNLGRKFKKLKRRLMIRSQDMKRSCKLKLKLIRALLSKSKPSKSHKVPARSKNSLLWRRHSRKQPKKLTNNDFLLCKDHPKVFLPKLLLKARKSLLLNKSKKNNRRHSFLNLRLRRSNVRLKSSRMKNLRLRLLLLRKNVNKKKPLARPVLLN